MTEGNRPKFPYLKKGIGQARILQRNVILNPPPPDISSSEKTQTSTQSLPLIENLSPITKELVTNIRPTTAETGDSGVRDVNLQVSPTFDTASIRTTVTTYHQQSPPKAPVQINEPIQYENEERFQRIPQNVPEKLGEENILRPYTSTPSETKSFTSLDRIKTPPIDLKATTESDQFSDFSAEIAASSRSKGSVSVGTSHVQRTSDEIEDNDSIAVLRDNIVSHATAGTSHAYNNQSFPLQHSSEDHETPINNRNRPPLFKSFSYGSLPYSIRRPYIDQTARRLGIHPPVSNYIIPPRPKVLESPDVVNGLGTPQASSTKNHSFFKSPILPEKFVQKEEGKIVESLAEQLRALIICFDAGMDGRMHKINQIKYIYAEKAAALKRKEQEMKQKIEAEEKKLTGAKAKLKLESDKMKQSDGTLKNLENELKEVKNKFVDTSRNLADIRQAKTQMEQKLKKAEEELQKEKEKTKKWEVLNGKLSNELSLERRMKDFIAKQSGNKTAQTSAPPQKEPTRQPFRPLQSRKPNRFGMQQNVPETHSHYPPQQQQELFHRRLTNTSTSSVESATKNVHWNLPNAENHDSSNNETHFTSLRTQIPSDSQLLHKIDDQSFVEEQYRRFGSYRIMKECQCELIRYDNNDLRYCCLKDVNVNVSYVDDNGQITVTLPGGYIVNIFPSMQLEIHRSETNEKSIVAPDGRRCEYFNLPNGEERFVDVIAGKDEGQRQFPDGKVEVLQNTNTKRNETDFVQLIENSILFCCPGFFVTRHLDKDFGGAVTVRVLTNDPSKTWKITICSEHRVFYVKHYNGNNSRRCFYTERRCDHLRN
uniref:Uncharacterized protein n=1 Tax=Panagrolaimus superbus TaxID=310955 RepID=A0A914YZW2_9BILA